MRRIIHHDVYVGTIMLLFSIFMYLKTFTMPAGAAQFPRLLFYLFVAFAFWILFQGIKGTKLINSGNINISDILSFKIIKLPLLSFSLVAIYAFLIKFLGFFLATSIFIVVFMIFYQNKNWKAMVLTIIGVNIFIYLLFVMQLHVPFPTGIFF